MSFLPFLSLVIHFLESRVSDQFWIITRKDMCINNSHLKKYDVSIGCKSQEKRGKSHKYDPKSTRFKKKTKESSLKHSRASSQQQHRSPSDDDDDDDESVPASYHTVSLQVSQDVSTARISSLPFPIIDCPCWYNLGWFYSELYYLICICRSPKWKSVKYIYPNILM